MNRALLYRLAAVTSFSLISLAIKSESVFCESTDNFGLKAKAFIYKETLNADKKTQNYKYDAFFIKI